MPVPPVVGIVAFVTALATGAPAAISVALGVISLSILPPTYALVSGENWLN